MSAEKKESTISDDTQKKEEETNGCLGKCGCLFLIGLYSLRFFIFDVHFHGYYVSYKGAFLSTLFTIDLWILYLMLLWIVFSSIVEVVKIVHKILNNRNK